MRKAVAIKLDEEDDGRVLKLKTGREMELRLPENPTTGYRWRVVKEGEPVCVLMGTDFKAGTRPGEPGVHIRRYRVVGPGQATLKLAYTRTWESADSTARTFCLKVLSRSDEAVKR